MARRIGLLLLMLALCSCVPTPTPTPTPTISPLPTPTILPTHPPSPRPTPDYYQAQLVYKAQGITIYRIVDVVDYPWGQVAVTCWFAVGNGGGISCLPLGANTDGNG